MKRLARIAAIALPLVGGLAIGYSLKGSETVTFRQVSDMMQQVLKYVNSSYYEKRSSTELMKSAISGMVSSLDDYSDFMDPSEMEDLDISTSGHYGGVGMQVGMRDKLPTVISPFEGSPASKAGLRPGDKIVEIDGARTSDASLSEVVSKLRGKPKTRVSLKVYREGLGDYLNVSIVRDDIRLKPVPYYTVFDGDIGYLRVASFSDSTARDARAAIEDLKAKGADKFILDLRGNPGGLLTQAAEVADLFLHKNAIVVYTKGIHLEQQESLYSLREPKVKEDAPVVVLVDNGSASASEIVAGALQDWDRALVIGDTSFGKGSVQRIFRLRPTDARYGLRLTIAKYYVPSGRSIHKDRKENTEEEEQDYRTKRLDRKVAGGVGIIPDIVVTRPQPTPLVSKILAKDLPFEFAISYVKKHSLPDEFSPVKLSDKSLSDFARLAEKKGIEAEGCEFETSREQLSATVSRTIADVKWGEAGRYAQSFTSDPVLKRTIEELKASKTAAQLFSKLGERN